MTHLSPAPASRHTALAALGAAIRQRRQARGGPRHELAELVQTDQARISQFELGHAAPTRAQFQRLVAVFGVELADVARLAGLPVEWLRS